ncbi:MAG: ATP-dependent RNA helicase DbpA [Gammaproteobacteria bacterium]|nr:ATP-dependent RNA helicase DbpA [Gammaproteobacteria bacterium]MBU1554513.1 ATP-dependent RNA helicase DbpA [Gammaproteobacteria bacterium]MBU2071972.1 ATP-dependent RNA helicase DbpA [Gammaproteobacteria bacterium]MBU2183943.1 ATP-dependent RNA helicase DbpA [Gammaproteobacteria bacterium]MBU2204334.1 ATP-dependent RNA helicase DbpA [Gammaproteobacteria bacterium]
MSDMSFSSLALPDALISNLADLGYNSMTDIQAQALPAILNGQDVIAQAKTGSGKTAAFGLGLLAKLDVKYFRVQTLVLCPTRELADQVAAELRKLARSIHNIKILTLCGGVPIGPQIGSLEHGAHIIVGTPGRVIDHLDKDRLRLDDLTTLILDEADRMLEMGFQADLDAVIAKAPAARQTLLFSATYPAAIAKLSERLLTNPLRVTVAEQHNTSSIQQQFFQITDNAARLDALRQLLLSYQGQSSMVFCNTKRETQDVADALHAFGFSVLALHGDMEQKDRDQTLVQFANGSACILVATDVAARGLDISSVDAVFNYQLAHDADTHTHRIGRTGRAGQSGIALSLFTASDAGKLVTLEDGLGIKIEPAELPSTAAQAPAKPLMATLQLDGGKKHKIRAGDIVGALTASKQLTNDDLGKIQLHDIWSFVAVKRSAVKLALQLIQQGKIKGKSIRARAL